MNSLSILGMIDKFVRNEHAGKIQRGGRGFVRWFLEAAQNVDADHRCQATKSSHKVA
jgi:hypothetical protein